MLQDLRHALRALRQAPGLTAAVLATLAVGLGAATAIFSVSYAVLLRPLPYGEPDRLVVLLHEGTHPVGPADFFDYRRALGTLESLSAAEYWTTTVTGEGRPERIHGLRVTADLFRTLRTDALIGRTLAKGEDAGEGAPVVVLSHALWTARFAADPLVLGRTMLLDGRPHVIVGVMPEDFRFAPFWATQAAIWKPLALADRASDRDGRSLRLFGRLAPGATLDSAQAEASAVAARLAAAYPETNTGRDITVMPLHEKTVGHVRPLLLVLAGMAALLLVLACANVSSLLLARALARHREIAIRSTLGASAARLVRQLLTESLVLAGAGGIAGAMVAVAAVRWLAAALPPDSLPRQYDLASGGIVFVTAGALAAVATLLCGLAPALQVRRASLREALQDTPRGATEGGGRTRLRRALVAAQIGLALAIVAGAGLMGQTLLRLQAVDPGFDPSRVLTAVVSVSDTRHATGAARVAFFNRLSAAIEVLPGVDAVSAINHLPLAGDIWRLGVEIEGQPAPPPGQGIGAAYRVVRPRYFETMRQRLSSGRDFTSFDREGAMPVAIINETMAQAHWPGADPIGRRIRMSGPRPDELVTIVGVVADAAQDDWTGAPGNEVYFPYAQHAGWFGGRYLTFVVRTAGDPDAMVPLIERTVWSLDSDLPVSEVATMEHVIGDELSRPRLSATLLSAFALAALALAAVGVYGVVAYSVSRRTREIGIRMALGARRPQVMALATRDALVPAALGTAVGFPLALAAAKAMESLLFEVRAHDALTFAAAPLLLAGIALAAAWPPALRASRVDPIAALRED